MDESDGVKSHLKKAISSARGETKRAGCGHKIWGAKNELS
jgi:hypothetical protein